jgi:hypothetical protein
MSETNKPTIIKKQESNDKILYKKIEEQNTIQNKSKITEGGKIENYKDYSNYSLDSHIKNLF